MTWRALKAEEVHSGHRLLIGNATLRGMQAAQELQVERAPGSVDPDASLIPDLGPVSYLLDTTDPVRSLRARVVVKNRADGKGTEMVVEVDAP